MTKLKIFGRNPTKGFGVERHQPTTKPLLSKSMSRVVRLEYNMNKLSAEDIAFKYTLDLDLVYQSIT